MSTAYMNLNLPTVGPLGTQGPEWANDINTALDLIDAHDHSVGKGKQITPSGININQTFSLNANQLSQISSLALEDLSSAPSGAGLIYEQGGELFFKDATGTAVQITSGGSVNVSGVGGIGGDYSTTPGALVSYNNTSKNYSFLQAASITASMDCGPVSIYRNVLSSPKATLQIQNSQSGNLNWSLPDLYPASILPLKVTNAGVIFHEQIKGSDVEALTLTSGQLAANSVTTTKITDLNVTTDKLAALSVTEAKLGALSVTNGKIGALAVTTDKIAADTIVNANINPVANIERKKLAHSVIWTANYNSFTSNTFYTTIASGTFTAQSYFVRLLTKDFVQPSMQPAFIKFDSSGSGNFYADFQLTIGGVVRMIKRVGCYMSSSEEFYFDFSVFDGIYYCVPNTSTSIQLEYKSSSASLTVFLTNLTFDVLEY